MAMTVQIDVLTGAGPTATAVTACVFNREDTVNGTTGVPVPTAAGTKFSWVKSFQVEITATGGLTMTNILVGKVANETVVGTKLWRVTSHAAYTQATTNPTDTGDNNTTPPTLNGAGALALELIATPPSAYSAGPHNTTGRKGNIVEISCGIDNTIGAGGSGLATPTLRWKWTEA